MKQADGNSRCRIWVRTGCESLYGKRVFVVLPVRAGELLDGQSRGMLVEPNS